LPLALREYTQERPCQDMERRKPRATNRVYTGVSLGYLALKDLATDPTVTFDRAENGAWTYRSTGLYAVHQNLARTADAAIHNESNVGPSAGFCASLS
jgi:hypothetical protein